SAFPRVPGAGKVESALGATGVWARPPEAATRTTTAATRHGVRMRNLLGGKNVAAQRWPQDTTGLACPMLAANGAKHLDCKGLRRRPRNRCCCFFIGRYTTGVA